MSEIDFAGEALKFKERLEDLTAPECLNMDEVPQVLLEIESAIRSIAQRVQENAAKVPNRPCVELCQEERAQGNGGCGACALCCKEQTVRAEIAEDRVAALRFMKQGESKIRADERQKWADRMIAETELGCNKGHCSAIHKWAKRLRENSDG